MSCYRNEIVLLPIPFTDLNSRKVRPAIVIGRSGGDLFLVPISSQLPKTTFALKEWKAAALNVPCGVKPQIASGVKMTGQMFGPTQIIAVLRGSRANRVLGRRHHRLSIFGSGKGLSAEEWRSLARELIRLGFVEQGLEFGDLRLTPKAWDVLHGKEKVLIPIDHAPVAAAPAAAPLVDRAKTILRTIARRRFHEIGELFASGQSILEIAQHYHIQTETVIEHLHRFHESGGALDPERVLMASHLPESERAQAIEAFERQGCDRLAPVYASLSGTVPYEELHLLRLYVLCRD